MMASQRELFVVILLCCVLSKAIAQRAQVCGCNIAMCTQNCNTGDRLSTGCYKSVRNWPGNTRSCDNVYSCRVEDYYNPKYEVHVLSSYEARTDHGFGYHPLGKADVRIVNSPIMGNDSRPLVLVLGSYEPITWNIEALFSERIKQVIVISYYSGKSQVTGVSSEKQEILQQTSTVQVGYGASGSDTRKMLKYIVKRYGPITSFTGRYTANSWTLTVGVPINVTDALKSKHCSDASSWMTGHSTRRISWNIPTRWQRRTSWNIPTRWQRRTSWNIPTWVHPTWSFHHTVESSSQYESSYSEWSSQKVPPKPKLEEMSVSQLDESLCEFYAEVRNKKGENYKKSSLITFRSGIERHLNNPPLNRGLKLTSQAFSNSNKMLNAKVKELKRQGKENVEHKEPITKTDLALLKTGPVLRLNNPLSLLRNVWFNVVLFCTDEKGKHYATMAHDEKTKNYQGGLQDKGSNEKTARMYETESETDGYTALKLYLSKLNPKCQALFQFPRRDWTEANVTDKCWYENRPLGVNSLGTMMKEISKNANLSQAYTNHCVRARRIFFSCPLQDHFKMADAY